MPALNTNAYDSSLTRHIRDRRDRLELAIDFLRHTDAPLGAIAAVETAVDHATEDLNKSLSWDYPPATETTTPTFTFDFGFDTPSF